MSARTANIVGSIMALGAAACWGSATVMSKGALDDFSPIFLLTIQICASAFTLWLAIFLKRVPVPSVRTLMKFAWLGLLEPGLAYFLGLSGLVNVTASAASLILTSESLMIVVLSFFILRERVSWLFMLFSLFAMMGLLLALGIEDTSFTPEAWIGLSLLGAAALSAAFYVVLSSRYVSRNDPIVIVASQQSVALVFALILLPFDFHIHGVPAVETIQSDIWLFAAVSGIIQYAAAFSLYLAAMRHISTGLAGMFLTFIPIFSIAGAYLFLNEKLNNIQFLGVFLTVGAILALNMIPIRKGVP